MSTELAAISIRRPRMRGVSMSLTDYSPEMTHLGGQLDRSKALS